MHKKGIATITALGLLIVITVLGFFVSTTIRNNSSVCLGYHDVTCARQFIDVALTRAIAQINISMKGEIYPPRVICSSNSSSISNAALNLMTLKVMNYLPQAIFNDTDFANINASWCDIRINNKTTGRYAFIAINSTGLLDANHAGGSKRSFGLFPKEIQLCVFPDIKSASEFTSTRSIHAPYESIAELNKLNKGIHSPAHYFFCDSYCAVDTNVCNLSKIEACPFLTADNAFKNSGFSNAISEDYKCTLHPTKRWNSRIARLEDVAQIQILSPGYLTL